MNAHVKSVVGQSLSECYQPFAQKLAEYGRLLKTDEAAAEKVFAEAQIMAAAWRAGVEYGARRR